LDGQVRIFRPVGIALVVLGAGLIGAAIVVPVAAVGLIGGGVATALVGVLFIWMHSFMKDVPVPAGGLVGGGFEEMAAGTARAKDFVEGMVAKNETSSILSSRGVDATATIHRVTDTGAVRNFNPVIELELLVSPSDGRRPYPVTTREAITRMSRARLAPGVTLQCRVDPLDEATIEVLI
jgi:hypothetical protein